MPLYDLPVRQFKFLKVEWMEGDNAAKNAAEIKANRTIML